MDRENHIAALIASAHARADDALRRCQAGHGADRDEPVAREWLRRWSPKRMVMAPVDCGCARGRCVVCN